MRKKDKAKNKRPIDSYLDKYGFGSDAGGTGQIFDMSTDMLNAAAVSSVSSLIATAMGKNPHPKVFDFTENQNPVMQNGGISQPNAEVEGEEVFETPNGQVGKFKGASHEQGGIDVELPPATKIFSKRLEKAGKSMAQRKIAREKSIASIEKQLEARPNDKILKQTLERVKETNSIEEQGDMMIQESMNAMNQAKNLGTYLAKYGGEVPKYWNGGEVPYAPIEEDIYKLAGANVLFDPNRVYKNTNPIATTIDPVTGLQDNIAQQQRTELGVLATPESNSYRLLTNYSGGVDVNNVKSVTETNASGIPVLENKDVTKSSTPVSDSTFKNPLEGYDFTPGDVMGMLGNKISGTAPLMTTLANRAGDTPNINAFLNYGKEGLNTLESTKGMLGINKANLMAQLGLQKTTTDKQARNSATSVNTLRGLNELSNAREQDMTAQVYDDYSKQMMGLLGQISQSQNQKDAMVMQGEQSRDLADRQDRDNFFTEINKDFINYGTSTQKMAQDLNVKEGDKDFLDLLSQMSKYGFGMRKDDTGKWEIYHADSGKKATKEEVKEKAKLQTYDFSIKKLGGNSKKQKVGEYSFDYNF